MSDFITEPPEHLRDFIKNKFRYVYQGSVGYWHVYERFRHDLRRRAPAYFEVVRFCEFEGQTTYPSTGSWGCFGFAPANGIEGAIDLARALYVRDLEKGEDHSEG